MNGLIYGVNPLLISSIEAYKFKRLGMHPMYHRLHKKRWGWLAWKSPHMFDWTASACVKVLGPNSQTLLLIEVHSNARANELRNELTEQLEDYLTSFRRHKLQAAIQGTR